MSDLDKYKEKVNQVEDSSLDSTARTLALLNEVGVWEQWCNVKLSILHRRKKLEQIRIRNLTIKARCWTGSRVTWTQSTLTWRRPIKPWPTWKSGLDYSHARGIGMIGEIMWQFCLDFSLFTPKEFPGRSGWQRVGQERWGEVRRRCRGPSWGLGTSTAWRLIRPNVRKKYFLKFV